MFIARTLTAATLSLGALIVSAETAQAACGATVNGRAMTAQECSIGRQVYGQVLPGTYTMDAKGNWYHHETRSRGNTYADARRNANRSNNCNGRSVFAQGYGGSCNGQRRSIFGVGN
ncbi:MAG: hypothetical protein AAFR93_07045 [Pseudomonadota bacterium]